MVYEKAVFGWHSPLLYDLIVHVSVIIQVGVGEYFLGFVVSLILDI